MNDSNLITRSLSGDDRAFDDLFDSVRDVATHSARRFSATSDDLDDYLQEMAIRLWRKLSLFDGPCEAFRSWSRVVFERVAIDLSRRKTLRRRLRRNFEPPPAPPLPDEIVARAEERVLLRRFIAGIRSPVRRQAVIHRHLQDLSTDEMTVAMERNRNTIKSLVKRGKRETLIAVKRLGYASRP